jgi:hypothetical protein
MVRDSRKETEQMMEELKCTGERITLDSILARIAAVEYETVILAGQKFMFCGIRMDNGFVAVGKPATCIDPSNWRDEIGQKVSYDNTFDELWKLEAYRKLSDPRPCP